MLRVKERAFAPLCHLSIEDLVPADHFSHHLEAKLCLSFVHDWVKEAYAEQLITIAHPPFRDQLREEARRLYHQRI